MVYVYLQVEAQEMMLRVELRPLAASIVVVVRQLDPSQVSRF